MSELLNEHLDQIKKRIAQVEDPNLNNINEGVWSTTKNAASKIVPQGVKNVASGLAGKHGVFQNIGRNYKNSSNIARVKSQTDKATGIFQDIQKTLNNNKSLFDGFHDEKNNINSLDVDQEIKDRYIQTIDALLQTNSAVNQATTHLLSNRAAYNIANGLGQQEAQPNTNTNEPTADTTQDAGYEQPDSGDTANDQDNGGGAKVFDISQHAAQIDEFMRNRRQAMNEAVQLDEAVKEGKFDEAMKMLYMNSARMIQAAAGPNVNHDALTVIMKLALATIMQKGQAAFVDDVKEINGGYNMYRKAHKNLYTISDKQKAAQAAQPEAPVDGGQGQVVDKTAEAVELAKEFLKEYGYQWSLASEMAAAKYILKNHLNQA